MIWDKQALQENLCIEMTRKVVSADDAPCLVTLRGQLYQQVMNVKPIGKKMAMCFFKNKLLHEVACCQATYEDKMVYYRGDGFKNLVAIRPKLIEADGIIDKFIGTPNKKRIEYIGWVFDLYNGPGNWKTFCLAPQEIK